MEEAQNRPEQELQRKPWHAPEVRWHDPRNAEHLSAGGLDGGASSARS